MELNSYFDTIKGLPASPQILPKLMEALRNPDITVGEVEAILKMDMSLSGQVVSLSNSSYFSFGEPSSSLNESIARIGIEETYTLVSSMVGLELVSMIGEDDLLDSDAIWKTSMSCAVAMEQLAKTCGKVESDAYSVGLFHNLGMIVINQMVGDQYTTVFNKVKADHVAFRSAEVELLGFNYVEVSSTLLEFWKFLPEIYIPVMNQHDPVEAKECKEMSAMLHLSLYMLSKMKLLYNSEYLEFEHKTFAMELLYIEEDQLEGIMERIESRINEVSGMLAK